MTVRKPMAWLQLATGFVALKHAEVSLSRMSMGSSFLVHVALDDGTCPPLAFWSTEAPFPASIVAENGDGTGQKTIIVGQIDLVEVELEKRLVVAHGSDLMSTFADTRSDQQFPNMTKSQVIASIVGKHGFTPHIDSTSDMAGKSYEGQEYTHLTDYENELDVIQQLANDEGKVAFMVGKDFYFTDPGNVQGSSFPIVYSPPSRNFPPSLNNGQSLRLRRNVQLASITSKAASYPAYDKQPQVGESDAPNDAPAAGGGSSFDEAGFE